ncbi:hypothetical protein CEUSTIGMA_g2187.t1 [Chlamydomonas eustigma]|uniref:Uncharacterized protein n=1 Tax=Chlamydomonas eustigma TaxID=1157962 RepID=A0A250WW39_9CHLO|nr:hypothetical protein CEUSTIGMA_g2187.t1 [Chlamydomonas eustigma]|eukprot:GAX74740.1 hypothetical protein CEUSTIGMA_g2187.t1 [Chlamydomonas eustigma]
MANEVKPNVLRSKGLARSLAKLAQARWAKLRLAVKGIRRALMLAQEDKAAFASETGQAINEAKSGSNGVKLVVDNAQDLKNINYMKQGDADLYTQEAIQSRHKIRVDSRVIDVIRDWWKFVPREVPEQGIPYLTKSVYCAMVVIIQMMLLPRFKMQGDIEYDPEEDWLDDNKGQDVMGYPDFFDALFELADMWCESVSAVDYAALLSQLLDDLKNNMDMWDMLLKKFGYESPQEPAPQLLSSPPEPQLSLVAEPSSKSSDFIEEETEEVESKAPKVKPPRPSKPAEPKKPSKEKKPKSEPAQKLAPAPSKPERQKTKSVPQPAVRPKPIPKPSPPSPQQHPQQSALPEVTQERPRPWTPEEEEAEPPETLTPPPEPVAPEPLQPKKTAAPPPLSRSSKSYPVVEKPPPISAPRPKSEALPPLTRERPPAKSPPQRSKWTPKVSEEVAQIVKAEPEPMPEDQKDLQVGLAAIDFRKPKAAEELFEETPWFEDPPKHRHQRPSKPRGSLTAMNALVDEMERARQRPQAPSPPRHNISQPLPRIQPPPPVHERVPKLLPPQPQADFCTPIIVAPASKPVRTITMPLGGDFLSAPTRPIVDRYTVQLQQITLQRSTSPSRFQQSQSKPLPSLRKGSVKAYSALLTDDAAWAAFMADATPHTQLPLVPEGRSQSLNLPIEAGNRGPQGYAPYSRTAHAVHAGRSTFGGRSTGGHNNAYGIVENNISPGGQVPEAHEFSTGSLGVPHRYRGYHDQHETRAYAAQRDSNFVTLPHVDVHHPESCSGEASWIHNNVVTFTSIQPEDKGVRGGQPHQKGSHQSSKNRTEDPRSKSMMSLMALHAPVMDMGGNLRSSATILASSRSKVVY